MTLWKSFGASVIGPGHVARGQANQDAWSSFHLVWGDGIVVSDGLGSKPYSDIGSRVACRAAIDAVRVCRDEPETAYAMLSDRIRNNWLSLVAPLEPYSCAATCLLAFRLNDAWLRLGMLGDGLAAAVKTDGSVVVLADDKSDGFSNITVALSPDVGEADWRWLLLPEEDYQSVVLCSDGVADDLRDVDGFVREFVGAHSDLALLTASRRAREMLENWPTPRHSDDKTIVCLFRSEVTDE